MARVDASGSQSPSHSYSSYSYTPIETTLRETQAAAPPPPPRITPFETARSSNAASFEVMSSRVLNLQKKLLRNREKEMEKRLVRMEQSSQQNSNKVSDLEGSVRVQLSTLEKQQSEDRAEYNRVAAELKRVQSMLACKEEMRDSPPPWRQESCAPSRRSRVSPSPAVAAGADEEELAEVVTSKTKRKGKHRKGRKRRKRTQQTAEVEDTRHSVPEEGKEESLSPPRQTGIAASFTRRNEASGCSFTERHKMTRRTPPRSPKRPSSSPKAQRWCSAPGRRLKKQLVSQEPTRWAQGIAEPVGYLQEWEGEIWASEEAKMIAKEARRG